jgi:hypothetical protein
MLAELAKCDVLCRACHVEEHYLIKRTHGAGGYQRGCRCDVCRSAKSVQTARYVGRNIEAIAKRRREASRKAGFVNRGVFIHPEGESC